MAVETSHNTFQKKRAVQMEAKQFVDQKKEADKYKQLLRRKNELLVKQILWKMYQIEKQIKQIEQDKTSSSADRHAMEEAKVRPLCMSK
jgi:structural maintenance of chromosome 1